MSKLARLAAVAFASVAVAIWLGLSFRKLSEQNLLREASKEALQIQGEGRERAFLWIAGQQAHQGFLGDARATLRNYGHLEKARELGDFAFVLAKNGDVEDAKKIADGTPDVTIRTATLKEIALALAERGDVQGARAMAASLPDRQGVENEICRYQIRSGDIEDALATAYAMPDAKGVNVLLALSESYDAQEKENSRRLALRVKTETNHKEEKWRWFQQWADSVLATPAKHSPSYSHGGCGHQWDVNGEPFAIALKAYWVGDIAGAEQELQSHPEDMARNARMIIDKATERGDIANALRFSDLVARYNPEDASQWRPVSALVIAKTWAMKENPATVVRWARSRPISSERAMALLGVAEGNGGFGVQKVRGAAWGCHFAQLLANSASSFMDSTATLVSRTSNVQPTLNPMNPIVPATNPTPATASKGRRYWVVARTAPRIETKLAAAKQPMEP